MAIYTGRNMPKEVGRTTMDPEVKSWLKDGPVLGSYEPIHVLEAVSGVDVGGRAPSRRSAERIAGLCGEALKAR
jgi:hypothetical protein